MKTEEEIQTLRQVLAARIKHSQDLKRKLGIGVWKELQNDLQAGIKNVQETTAYVFKFYPSLSICLNYFITQIHFSIVLDFIA